MTFCFWRKPKPATLLASPATKDDLRLMEARLFGGLTLMTTSNADKLAHIAAQLAVLNAALSDKSSASDADGAQIDAISATVDALVAAHVPAPAPVEAPVADPTVAQ